VAEGITSGKYTEKMPLYGMEIPPLNMVKY
jgi:hypothetical protein